MILEFLVSSLNSSLIGSKKSLLLLWICTLTAQTSYALDRATEKITIRAQCIMTPGQEKHWVGLLNLSPLLEDLGIIFVDNEPDLILCNHFTPNIKDLNKPVIILEKRDAASIGVRTRKIIHEPNVLAVFKNRALRDKSIDNNPLIEQNLLLTKINEYAQLQSTPQEVKQLSANDLAKIHVVTWDFLQSSFNGKLKKLREKPLNLANIRTIDVSFVGSINCKKASEIKNNYYRWHRTKALEAITKMQNICAYAQPGKTLAYDDYIALMDNSKICVSPWGFGEWCYRDIEAILCGAILIKPDTDFVHAEPDIYHKNIYYVACKPDFSDLEERITYILKNYNEFAPMRMRAYQLVQESGNPQVLASTFATAVHKIMNT